MALGQWTPEFATSDYQTILRALFSLLGVSEMDLKTIELIMGMGKKNASNGSNPEIMCRIDYYLKQLITSLPNKLECPVTDDTTRNMCWPATELGHYAYVVCDDGRNLSRLCTLEGVWSPDFDTCQTVTEAPQVAPESSVHLLIFFYIYCVGYSISLLLLLISLWIFARNKNLWCLRNFIHCNMALCFALHNIAWILYSIASKFLLPSTAQTTSVFCWLPITCLKYFITAGFFWMFAEGVHLLVLVFFTFHAHKAKFSMYAVLGWGVPFALVASATTVKHLKGQQSCYDDKNNMSDYIFIGPVLLVLFLNVIFLLLIMCVVVSKLRSECERTKRHARGVRALLILCPLLGVTYVLTLIRPNNPYWLYLCSEYYTVLVSASQGALVAVVLRFKKEVQEHRDLSQSFNRSSNKRTRLTPRSMDLVPLRQFASGSPEADRIERLMGAAQGRNNHHRSASVDYVSVNGV